jgi:hypothetical protein
MDYKQKGYQAMPRGGAGVNSDPKLAQVGPVDLARAPRP